METEYGRDDSSGRDQNERGGKPQKCNTTTSVTTTSVMILALSRLYLHKSCKAKVKPQNSAGEAFNEPFFQTWVC